MQAKRSDKLTARDFVYVYEPGIGQTYQNGPYLIGVGRTTYACNYKGQCFSWGLESFNEAIRACAKHDTARRAQDAHRYTQRCEQAEAGLLPRREPPSNASGEELRDFYLKT